MIEAGIKRNPNDPTPLLPETCDRLPIAEQARRELIRDISKKISRIQDKSLDELEIRKLNDEINELVRKKYAWDRRIHELGGIERKSVQIADKMGAEEPNVHGYYYFGRAKELPGVKEMLQPKKEDHSALTKKKQELLKNIDHEYYGFGEEKDERLLKREGEAEQKLSTQHEPLNDWVTGLPTILPEGTSLSEPVDLTPDVHIPSQEEIQKFLVDQKKAALLSKLETRQ